MNALLVYPRFPITYWGLQYGLRLMGKRATLPPLGLLTVAALLPIEWRLRLVDLNVDVLSPRRRFFWRLMAMAISKGAGHLRQAVARAVQGAPLVLYTRKHLVPRMERALAEIEAGVQHTPRRLPSAPEAPRATTASEGSRPAAGGPVFTVQNGVDSASRP